MLKKFISSLIIFSLFYTDVANAMQSEDLFHDDMNAKVRSHPSPLQHTQPLRRTKSSGDFSTSQGPLHPLKTSPFPRVHSHQQIQAIAMNLFPKGHLFLPQQIRKENQMMRTILDLQQQA